MPPTAEALIKGLPADPNKPERVSQRREPPKMAIEEPNPAWPTIFSDLKTLISTALGPTALSIEHSGSTSVPGLPAKAVIDIDIIVADPLNENLYVPPLEAAGFHFILRDPEWNSHRFFVRYEPAANVHVFPPDTVAVLRHRIFREWLRAHPEDRERYAEVKRGVMGEAVSRGEGMQEYTERKDAVIVEIMKRAVRELGYV